MLPKKNRITKKKDFDKVFKKGKGLNGNFLFLKTFQNDQKFSRFGFVISQKVSKKAVIRNKRKRTLSEIIREKMSLIEKGSDIIILTKPGIEKKDFQQIKEELDTMLFRAKLIKHKNN